MRRPFLHIFYISFIAIGLAGAGFADGGCKPARALNDGVMGGAAPLCIPVGAMISAEGDSLTYGMDTVGGVLPAINGASFMRSASPYPERLQETLGHGVKVANRGFPGDVALQGEGRWGAVKPAQLVMIMYGTNDAARYVPLPEFKATLGKLVSRRVAQGAKVVLLVPPLAEDPALEKLIVPYRAAVKEVAKGQGVYVFDTVEALKGVKVLWTDGLHLTAKAYALMGERMAGYIGFETPTDKKKD